MARAQHREKTLTEKIFENILFLAEVFGDKADKDIPNVPVIELARCFELSHPRASRVIRRRRKPWSHWR